MIFRPDSRKLVFVDEIGTNTWLAPLHAYSLRGHRACAKVSRNRGPNTTLFASMSLDGMRPSMSIEGSTSREVFEAYVGHFLTPE